MTEITTCYRQEQQKTTTDTAPISLEPETESTVCSSSNFETGEKLPGLMSFNFYCDIQLGGSEFKNLVLSGQQLKMLPVILWFGGCFLRKLKDQNLFNMTKFTVMRSQWEVVKQEICIMDRQPTSLKRLADAVMSLWPKISEECL